MAKDVTGAITEENAAVESVGAKLLFTENSNNSGNSRIAVESGEIVVEVETLDRSVPRDWERIDLLVMDVEGSEVAAMSGAGEVLGKTRYLYVEFAPEHLAARLGLNPDAAGLADQDLFESIYHPGKLLLLATWRSAPAAANWTPDPSSGLGKLRHRRVRVIRDYGMHDRREAPQFYPEVPRARNVAAE